MLRLKLNFKYSKEIVFSFNYSFFGMRNARVTETGESFSDICSKAVGFG